MRPSDGGTAASEYRSDTGLDRSSPIVARSQRNESPLVSDAQVTRPAPISGCPWPALVAQCVPEAREAWA
jgi:hypothetical protein